jgi:hydroxyacylglutathione hydrolase
VSNLKYCAHVEPDNAATRARLEAAQAARAAGRPTVPSTLAQELATNVFLRTQEPAVIAFTHPGREPGGVDPVEVLHVLRDKKNSWKPT